MTFGARREDGSRQVEYDLGGVGPDRYDFLESTMASVKLPDLGELAATIVRRVHDTGEVVDIEEHGVVVARVVPVSVPESDQAELDRLWDDLDEIATEINASWPKGVSAEDAINDVRREL